MKILDFGLARVVDKAPGVAVSAGSRIETLTTPLSGAGTIVGPLQYMSSEQFDGREADGPDFSRAKSG